MRRAAHLQRWLPCSRDRDDCGSVRVADPKSPSPRSPSQAAADLFREALPRAIQHIQRAEQSSEQTIAWLVGLSSTLLALSLADPGRVKELLGPVFHLTVGGLLTSVISGVLYRIVSLVVSARRTQLMLGLENHLTGIRAFDDVDVPSILDDEWDRAEIVRRLQDDFGVDYSFLVTYGTPIEGCREAYASQYKIVEEAHEENMAVIRRAVGAYCGLTTSEEARLFDPIPQPDCDGPSLWLELSEWRRWSTWSCLPWLELLLSLRFSVSPVVSCEAERSNSACSRRRPVKSF